MLALKNVLAEDDGIDSLVFDEVDTGVSGRAAQKVAEKMAQVARKKQVLCVTHLPQIAAMADTMGGLPVLGALFRAVTFRSYEAEEGENHVSISVPQVLGEAGSQGAEASMSR